MVQDPDQERPSQWWMGQVHSKTYYSLQQDHSNQRKEKRSHVWFLHQVSVLVRKLFLYLLPTDEQISIKPGWIGCTEICVIGDRSCSIEFQWTSNCCMLTRRSLESQSVDKSGLYLVMLFFRQIWMNSCTVDEGKKHDTRSWTDRHETRSESFSFAVSNEVVQ